MATTSSRKATTEINKLASLDAEKATAPDEAIEELSEPCSETEAAEPVIVALGAVDSVTISLSVRPAEHGLPEFPL
jgi:hypothetical protein